MLLFAYSNCVANHAVYSKKLRNKTKMGIGKVNDSNTFFLFIFHFDPPAFTVGGPSPQAQVLSLLAIRHEEAAP